MLARFGLSIYCTVQLSNYPQLAFCNKLTIVPLCCKFFKLLRNSSRVFFFFVFYVLIVQVPSGTFLSHFDAGKNIKRILKTPIIIYVFIMCSLFTRTVISSSLCARRREGFRHKYSFQDLLGLACHLDEKESWGFLCLPLISLTDAGSANQIQL